jgi:xanthine dehydrogenase accessory factor
MSELTRIAAALSDAARHNLRSVLATVVRTEGSTYRKAGARLLIVENGARTGTVSAGCLEKDILGRAASVMAGGEPEVVRYDTRSPDDLIWGYGIGCGGLVEVLLEPLTPADAALKASDLSEIAAAQQVRLAICGGGADVPPVVDAASRLGWGVTTIAHPSHLAECLVGVASGAVVIMSHHFERDADFLEGALRACAWYIGVMGPRHRTDALVETLQSRRMVIDAVACARIRGPIGLDIGAESPEEIALAIVAEVQAVHAGRSARFLADRPGSIHARL